MTIYNVGILPFKQLITFAGKRFAGTDTVTSDRKPYRLLRKMKIRKTITLEPKIAKKANAKAKEENRTFSNFIENILGKYFQKLKKEK